MQVDMNHFILDYFPTIVSLFLFTSCQSYRKLARRRSSSSPPKEGTTTVAVCKTHGNLIGCLSKSTLKGSNSLARGVLRECLKSQAEQSIVLLWVARTLYVRVAQRQEINGINLSSVAAYKLIKGSKEGPLVPPEPGRNCIRATYRSMKPHLN